MRCSNFTTPSRTSEEDSHLSKNSGKMVENKFLSFGIMQGLNLRDHSLKSYQFETSISLDFLNANKGGISVKYSVFCGYYYEKKMERKRYRKCYDFEEKHQM